MELIKQLITIRNMVVKLNLGIISVAYHSGSEGVEPETKILADDEEPPKNWGVLDVDENHNDEDLKKIVENL